MNLTIGERFAIAGILPTEGNFVDMTVARNLRTRLDLTEKEGERFGLDHIIQDGVSAWRQPPPKDDIDVEPLDIVSFLERDTEIELGDHAVTMIVKQLGALNDNNTLGEQHVTLYQRFIQDPKDASERETLHEVRQEASA